MSVCDGEAYILTANDEQPLFPKNLHLAHFHIFSVGRMATLFYANWYRDCGDISILVFVSICVFDEVKLFRINPGYLYATLAVIYCTTSEAYCIEIDISAIYPLQRYLIAFYTGITKIDKPIYIPWIQWWAVAYAIATDAFIWVNWMRQTHGTSKWSTELLSMKTIIIEF